MPMIDLSDLQARVWQTAEVQGHHENLRDLDPRLQTLVRLALAHTEVSEAWEWVFPMPAYMNTFHASIAEHLEEELADTAIRLLEMCWCLRMPLIITPAVIPTPTNATYVLRQLGLLHALIDCITQSVKRHGITPEVGALTQNALECCWNMALGLGLDLAHAIEKKDAFNQARSYQFGTPGERAL